LLIRIITDVFRSNDLSGWAKAAWTICLILVPFLTALIYLIVRGTSMHTRDAQRVSEADQAMRAYIQSASGSSSSTAADLRRLADLRDRGVLTEPEFNAQKAKLVA
jgi:hypothetical protein